MYVERLFLRETRNSRNIRQVIIVLAKPIIVTRKIFWKYLHQNCFYVCTEPHNEICLPEIETRPINWKAKDSRREIFRKSWHDLLSIDLFAYDETKAKLDAIANNRCSINFVCKQSFCLLRKVEMSVKDRFTHFACCRSSSPANHPLRWLHDLWISTSKMKISARDSRLT